MKKIGILGGTFDPPHNAHYEIARRAIEQYQLECNIYSIWNSLAKRQ